MNVNQDEVLAQSRAAYGQWGEQWKAQCKQNGELFKKSGNRIKDEVGLGIGRQAIICGMGSGIEQDIEVIKANRGKADVVCVDKAFSYLVNHGIIPDVCVMADANVPFDKYCKPFLGHTKTVKLVANINGQVDWCAKWKGPVFFYVNKDNIESEKIFSKISGCHDLIPASSNVGNTAIVYSGMVLGYDRLLLAGYDYAWKQDTNYYAFEDNDKRYWQKQMFSVGIDGELCYTSANLNFGARWMMDFLRAGYIKGKVINCSRHGLLVMPHSSLLPRLEEWSNRVPTEEERQAIINARMHSIDIEYKGIDELEKEINKHKFIAGVTIHYVKEWAA